MRYLHPASWFDEARQDQRKACGVPSDLKAQTKPEIRLELLKRAIGRQSLHFRWVSYNQIAFLGIMPAIDLINKELAGRDIISYNVLSDVC